jgi:DNA-binding response OmpR family regulator
METPNVPLILVEDEPDLRDALGEYFDACGFAVTAVSTATEALRVTPSVLPRILLTDLSLPDRRGDSFLEEFHRTSPHCLLYIHSGDSTFVPSASLRACGLSDDHVFSKPADLAEMVARFHSDLAV